MKLAHIQDGMKSLQQRLDSADSIKKSSLSDVENIMQGQFSKLSENIQKELKRLVESNNSTQGAATTQAVQNAVYQSTQTQLTLLNSLQKIANDADSASKLINSEIGKASSRKDVAELSKQLLALGLQIDSLPKQFPIPKDTDLSGLSKGIKELKSAISSIKFPEIPKTVDITPQLKAMEERMGKRVVEFEVIRGMNGLIEKIVVTEGDI